MDGPPGLSGASPATPATISDLVKQSHEPLDHAMAFEYTEQLLTPENSRSETSSNNENASHEEKPTLRRRSTRVTRASLRGAAQLEFDSEIIVDELKLSATTTEHICLDEPLDNGTVPRRKNGASRSRHSIAVMESTLQAEPSLVQDPMDVDDEPVVPDTPISNSSHEPQVEQAPAALLPRTLRKRVEQALARDKGHGLHKDSNDTNADEETPIRRSSRLSVLGKVSELVGRATGVLGKRSSSSREDAKEPDRLSSLRPRRVGIAKEEPADEPPSKKQRVSDNEPVVKTKSELDSTQEELTPPEVITRFKEKRWLTHGLYSGQEYTNLRPSQMRTEKRRKGHNASHPNHQRRLLPLPMFAGERLLQTGRDFELPFDIYSPLPAGQPKPNEWKKTNKNVFVGEAGSIWRANKVEEFNKCDCKPETGCDQYCQNRYMFYECDNKICALGPECGNRNFEELKQRAKAGGKYNVGVEVIKTADRGYGVRSNRTFQPNQIIVEYTGEIITQAECEKRMRTIYKKNECYYLMYFDQNMIIDATRGSIARFVNHGCEPNCRMEKWTVAGKPRMALFAGDRGIMTGEELTYDYNFDPYSQKNVQQCRCGSAKCRGILGPRKREKEQRAEMRAAKLKELADAKKANAAKRRKENALNKTRSRSIKSGVKKAVSKARMTVSKAAASRKKPATGTSARRVTKKPTNASTKGTSTTSKRNIKLPIIKTTKAKAKATVRVRKPAQSTKAAIEKPLTSPSKSRSRAPAAKNATATKGSSARKQPSELNKEVLKDVRESINLGAGTKSPRAKSSARTSARSFKAKKQS
ncbi:hypothetical protein BDW74DRAFT_129319 [Aspergillus multicolor]|uniref:putative histone-lysine N-methyltransferase (Ash1) n=1 Tax=Aspergillus multicolor TaxID=41759 RepID=UPI003CCD5B46